MRRNSLRMTSSDRPTSSFFVATPPAKIANQLLGFLFEGYGIDYIDKRNGLVNAVTLDDVKRVAARLLKADELIVTVVGKPQGLARQ